jgi:hypothetical protein
MNHIHRLQAQVRSLKHEQAALQDSITDLVAYITSSKFRCGDPLDGYVNVQDVLNRIADARRAANDAAAEYSDIYGKF